MTYFAVFTSVVKHQLGPSQLLWAAGTALVTQKNVLEGPVYTDWQEGKKEMKLKHDASCHNSS